MITIAFLLTLILFGISIIKSCQMFDRIIQREHDVYNKYWIMDGKPVGFFWYSNETVRPFDSYNIRWRLSMQFFLKTPVWVSMDQDLASMRKCRLWAACAIFFGAFPCSVFIMDLIESRWYER